MQGSCHASAGAAVSAMLPGVLSCFATTVLDFSLVGAGLEARTVK